MSQKAKASSKIRDSGKYSEAAEEIIVPKLVFTPSSNHHKWKKQILKQLKRNFGSIHDAVVSPPKSGDTTRCVNVVDNLGFSPVCVDKLNVFTTPILIRQWS